MINVAIVEDHSSEVENLRQALLRYQSETKEDISITHYPDAKKLLQNYKATYDVIFMDIEMPLMNGMEAAHKIRELDDNVIIIFVTNMVKYAVQGYKVGALDYFVKPVTYYDLKLRMEQVRFSLESKAATVSIPLADGVKNVLSSKVYYLEIMNHQLTYHTVDGNYSISSGVSLSKLEKQYANIGFLRCSSSFLVNLDWCTELKSDTVKVGKDILKISRGMKKNFVSSLSQRFVKKW